jgi:galactokinase
MEISYIQDTFQSLFPGNPTLVRSPGRVNLIGEHTDYNMGFVLPAAINKEILFAVAENGTGQCNLYATDVDQHFSFSLNQLARSDQGWPNYIMGVVDQLQRSGHALKGFNCVFGGNIPLGAGLSSSAALECGMAAALDYIFNLGVDKISRVKLSQKAENEFVGVNCGIMDQFASTFGKKGHVIQLDCRSLEYEYFPFSTENYKIVLIDTSVHHSLASSEYNVRRQQCEMGVAVIQKHEPGVKSLRDVSLEMLHQYQNYLEPVILQRCKYVIEENQRVEDACQALLQNDLSLFGQKMYASHQGLSQEYEVSCAELDFLVAQAKKYDTVLGARMMGGGFGGCTINLVEDDGIEKFTAEVTEAYRKAMHKDPKVYIGEIVNGTEILA